MRFEKIKSWEWVNHSQERHNKRLLLKALGERVLVNNLLKYMYSAKIVFFEFDFLRAKIVKKNVIFTNLRWKILKNM